MNREKWIDIAKGIGICLVVLAHCGAPGSRFINEFHMAMFFTAAGFCFSDKYTESIKNIAILVWKRIKSLYIPFILINIFLVLTHNFLMKYNIYTEDPEFLLTYTGKIYGISPRYESWQIKIWLKQILLFQSEQQLAGATWFLRTLFLLTITFALLNYIFRKVSKNNFKMQLFANAVVSLIFLSISTWYNVNNIHLPLYYNTVLETYIFYSIGFYFRKYGWNFTKKGETLIIVISALGLLVCDRICVYWGWNSSVNNFSNPFIFLASSLSGTFLVFSISKKISGLTIGIMLSGIGQKTMIILLLHFICFKLITLLQVTIYKEPSYMLASFPVLRSENGWWIIYALVGLSIPIIISMLVKNLKLLKIEALVHKIK